MPKTQKRRHNKRFDIYKDLSFDFEYDFETRMKISSKESKLKFRAQTQNVSCEGLCLRTDQELHEGDRLNLELFVPGNGSDAVAMEGEVCWIKEVKETLNDPHHFDAGLHLVKINGKSVQKTIHYDEAYHLYWSEVLESILGKFRIIQQKMQKS